MFRTALLALGSAPAILLSILAPTLPAQEQPRPRPEGVGERMPMSGRVEMYSMRRGRLGVVVSPSDPETDSIGALIRSVTPSGPADKAGIRSGDIIVRVNGRTLAEPDPRLGQGRPAPGLALSLIAARINPGDSVVVLYQRGKDRRNTTVVAGEDPVWTFSARDPQLADLPLPERGIEGEPEIRMKIEAGPPRNYMMRTPGPRILVLGPLADLELAPINPELGRYFGTSDGVLVINVPDDSKLGLKPGDVVYSVDGRRVKLPGQLLRVLQSYDPGENFKLQIMRMKKRETVTGSVTPESAPLP